MSEERDSVGAQLIAPSLQHSTSIVASRAEGAITDAINLVPTCVEGHCITCSDEALPARVRRVDQESGLARVTVQDTAEEIDKVIEVFPKVVERLRALSPLWGDYKKGLRKSVITGKAA